jgi:hypothetical protein
MVNEQALRILESMWREVHFSPNDFLFPTTLTLKRKDELCKCINKEQVPPLLTEVI